MAKRVHISQGLNANQKQDLVLVNGLEETKFSHVCQPIKAPSSRYHNCISKPGTSPMSPKDSITTRGREEDQGGHLAEPQ